MRFPARSLADLAVPFGAAKRNVDGAKPSSKIVVACEPESASKSSPVIPTSRVPRPTYVAMSRGRKKKNSTSFSGS